MSLWYKEIGREQAVIIYRYRGGLTTEGTRNQECSGTRGGVRTGLTTQGRGYNFRDKLSTLGNRGIENSLLNIKMHHNINQIIVIYTMNAHFHKIIFL